MIPWALMFLPPFVWAALLAPALLAVAAPTVTLEKTARLPRGWSLLRRASDDDALPVFVALARPRMADLHDRLLRLGDLTSRAAAAPTATGHLTRDEARRFGRADEASFGAVLGWLQSQGMAARATRYDSWIGFDLTAAAARRLLGADLAWYSYEGAPPVLRAEAYGIPPSLAPHVDFIHPLAHFMPLPPPPPTTTTKTAAVVPARVAVPPLHDAGGRDVEIPCATGVFPECIKKMYNITYDAAPPSPCRFGVAGFLDQYANYADVAAFLDAYAPDLAALDPPYNFSVELVHNGSNLQDPIWTAGLEASLDVQYAMAVGFPAAVTYYSTGGRGVKLDGSGAEIPPTGSDNEPYLELLQALAAKPDADLPHVLSISYADDEQSVPPAYARRVCDEIARLAARGVSVLAASGDGGAAGTGQSYCYSNDAARRPRLIATFPASCPWVTAVGATNNDGPPASAAAFSAGGFSGYFARPAWQDAAVVPYLARLADRNDSKLGLFDQAGRAIPDVSAVGTAFQIEYGGGGAAVLGTSAATPVVAAVVALVNDARLRAGKPSLGLLNPILYSDEVRALLTDVVRGRSQGCSFGDEEPEGEGWAAEAGYDCVTGLGVPGDFGKLLAALV